MFKIIVKNLFRLKRDDKGATLVEYGIALGLAIAVGAGALATLGSDVGATYGSASAALPTQAAAP